MKHLCPTIHAFIDLVAKTFEDYDSNLLGRITGLEYVIYRDILEHNGGNQLDVPHTGIRMRQKLENNSKKVDQKPYSTGADPNIPISLIRKAITFSISTA